MKKKDVAWQDCPFKNKIWFYFLQNSDFLNLRLYEKNL